jgi:hypothetical protein
LEQLDWCFTSSSWISIYPNTLMLPLARTTSDHTPCMIQIGTSIPKDKVFRFENFWIDQPGFLDIVQVVWQSEFKSTCSATKLSTKFKLLRRMLRRWAQNLSNLKKKIQVCNEVVLILDKLRKQKTLLCRKEFQKHPKGTHHETSTISKLATKVYSKVDQIGRSKYKKISCSSY